MPLKLKLKSGEELVDSYWNPKSEVDSFTLNLKDRWTYIDYWQTKSVFVVKTNLGDIGFAFAGDCYELSFLYENKDQILFSVEPLSNY